ncbi:MAG TPA: hypothetical protein VJR06_09785 [Nitrososphaerales archaeon]|nr:hypothetical protein [Nitrososphaerales archaeon]
MKPEPAVGIELIALAAILGFATFVPSGLLYATYVALAALLSTYLIHCPAHYFVGRILGIRFRSIRAGTTTLSKVLPPRFAGVARHLPVLTLSTEKGSMVRTTRRRAAAMYASGTVASVGSAIAVAAAATASGPYQYSALAWAAALSYLLFDLAFSPRSGDLFRARNALMLTPAKARVDTASSSSL